MPLPTSDFHTTVCLEMRMLKNQQRLLQAQSSLSSSQILQANCITLLDPTSTTTTTTATIMYNTVEMPIKQTALNANEDANNSTCNNNNNNIINSINNSIGTPLNNNYPMNSGGAITNNNFSKYQQQHSVESVLSVASRSQYQSDLASVDSSDTYASCQTHPFLSQGDLTSDPTELDTNNLYVNPMEKEGELTLGQVKKSASGDTALRNYGISGISGCGSSFEDDPTDYQAFQTFATQIEPRGGSSSTSLNETPVPKHRKARFQSCASSSSSQNKPRARFIDMDIKRSEDSIDGNVTTPTNNSSNGSKKTRRKLFETKGLASATKLINQHLFGIQGLAGKGNHFIKSLSFE